MFVRLIPLSQVYIYIHGRLWKWEIPKTSQDQWFQYSGCLIIDDLEVPHFRTPPYVLFFFSMTFILCAKATAEPQRAESYAGRASPCKSTGGGCMGLGSQRLRSATEQWLLNPAWLMIRENFAWKPYENIGQDGKWWETIGKYRKMVILLPYINWVL